MFEQSIDPSLRQRIGRLSPPYDELYAFVPWGINPVDLLIHLLSFKQGTTTHS